MNLTRWERLEWQKWQEQVKAEYDVIGITVPEHKIKVEALCRMAKHNRENYCYNTPPAESSKGMVMGADPIPYDSKSVDAPQEIE